MRALVFLSALLFANAVYFQLDEGKQRCFLEEVPKDTLVVGKYRSEDGLISNYGTGTPGAAGAANQLVKVTVMDPEGNFALQRELVPQGRFAFTAQTAGEYKICFLNGAKSGWFGAKPQHLLL